MRFFEASIASACGIFAAFLILPENRHGFNLGRSPLSLTGENSLFQTFVGLLKRGNSGLYSRRFLGSSDARVEQLYEAGSLPGAGTLVLLERDRKNGIYPGELIYHPVSFFIRKCLIIDVVLIPFMMINYYVELASSISSRLERLYRCLICSILTSIVSNFSFVITCLSVGYYGIEYTDNMFKSLSYNTCDEYDLLFDIDYRRKLLATLEERMASALNSLARDPKNTEYKNNFVRFEEDAGKNIQSLGAAFKAAFKAAERRNLTTDELKSLQRQFKILKASIKRHNKEFRKYDPHRFSESSPRTSASSRRFVKNFHTIKLLDDEKEAEKSNEPLRATSDSSRKFVSLLGGLFVLTFL